MSYEIIEQAVRECNPNHDAQFAFTRKLVCKGGLPISQIHVRYLDGNEYLRLDHLLDQLRAVTEVQVFEYRGRGREETPRLVADVKFGDKIFQLLYDLPNDA
jgi:hypothetical protein